jgi:hypothetical protein
VDDRIAAVKAALEAHPAVTAVRLTGSRAEGGAHELSDWDLYVRTDDFDRVAGDLPALLEPFSPLVCFWDPYADHDALMTILPGPTKVDICFFDRPREYGPAYEVTAETLPAIDGHFWDWILWTEQKRVGGKDDQVRESLEVMYEKMLGPMGAARPPGSVPDALAQYVEARDRLEEDLGICVTRELEREVSPVIGRS